MSQLFLRTLREDPADAEVPSHKLLVRAGYIRRVAAGVYSWLPLGKMVLENVTRVVRTEMNDMGGQEVLLPALLPREPYEATGRWEEYGPQLFRLTDRRAGDYLLGPTHEEIFTLMVKGECSSYKDLPVILYQIQTKYRDEARPRSGILRGREFLMKDSYSFDLDDDGLRKSYGLHRDAYMRIFDRLGLRYRIVSAVSGAMGGSRSEEFLAPTPVGEDTFVACRQCDYAANVEAVQVRPPDVDATVEHPALEVLDTPDTPTIDTLAALLDVPASATLKNLLVTTESGEIVAVGVPGDRDVDLDRLAAVLGPVELFDDFAGRPDLVKGYVGPQGLPPDVRFLADPRIAPGTAWVTGANEPDRHARDVVCGRDFAVPEYADVATIQQGDPCPRCGAALALDRAI
ncbi:MAG: proline--tRNA ligase, partial [Actinomadura sp.]